MWRTRVRVVRSGVPTPRCRRSTRLRYALVALLAVLAGATGASAWGAASRPLGPLQADVGLAVAWGGGTEVAVPPLGTVALDTHRGPVQIRVTVTEIRPEEARQLLAGATREKVLTSLTDQARRAAVRGAVTSCVVALLTAVLACALVFRRWRAGVLGGAVVLAGLLSSAGLAAATWRPEALSEPRLTGALARAPGLVGAARDFDAYGKRVAELALNVSRIYGTLTTLPAPPAADAIRVLWVSDIHNNPQAFDVMEQLAEQFQIEAVFDTGDLTDLGSELETLQLPRVNSLGVPYVFVRGNHDSKGVTQAFLQRQPQVVVLDDAAVVEVAGLRVAGTGDPVFRVSKEVADERAQNREALTDAGQALADRMTGEELPLDVALVHQPLMSRPLLGTVPLVLNGHVHERRQRWQDGTLQLMQGSSGGAGLRSLDGEVAEPLEMSVLHFDRTDGQLLAVDEVSIAGVGSRSVTVQRRDPASYREDGELQDDTESEQTAGPGRSVGPSGTAIPIPTDAPG